MKLRSSEPFTPHTLKPNIHSHINEGKLKITWVRKANPFLMSKASNVNARPSCDSPFISISAASRCFHRNDCRRLLSPVHLYLVENVGKGTRMRKAVRKYGNKQVCGREGIEVMKGRKIWDYNKNERLLKKRIKDEQCPSVWKSWAQGSVTLSGTFLDGVCMYESAVIIYKLIMFREILYSLLSGKWLQVEQRGKYL